MNFSNEIIELAGNKALKMISANEKISKLDFAKGNDLGFIWIATDPELLINPTEKKINEELFFIALFKKAQ